MVKKIHFVFLAVFWLFSVPGIKANTMQDSLRCLKSSHNPVLPGYYADPEVMYPYKTGKYYIYPTSDGFHEWSGHYFKAYSSTDLKAWKDEGIIFDFTCDLTWADKRAWAPCIIERKIDGKYKYFYYYSADKKLG